MRNTTITTMKKQRRATTGQQCIPWDNENPKSIALQFCYIIGLFIEENSKDNQKENKKKTSDII